MAPLLKLRASSEQVRNDSKRICKSDAEFVGLSLSYGLSLNSVFFYMIWMGCLTENKMVSVERIKQFTSIPSETEWRIKGCLPVANWPAKGHIDIIDLKVTS